MFVKCQFFLRLLPHSRNNLTSRVGCEAKTSPPTTPYTGDTDKWTYFMKTNQKKTASVSFYFQKLWALNDPESFRVWGAENLFPSAWASSSSSPLHKNTLITSNVSGLVVVTFFTKLHHRSRLLLFLTAKIWKLTINCCLCACLAKYLVIYSVDFNAPIIK